MTVSDLAKRLDCAGSPALCLGRREANPQYRIRRAETKATLKRAHSRRGRDLVSAAPERPNVHTHVAALFPTLSGAKGFRRFPAPFSEKIFI